MSYVSFQFKLDIIFDMKTDYIHLEGERTESLFFNQDTSKRFSWKCCWKLSTEEYVYFQISFLSLGLENG